MRLAHISDLHLCTKYKRENISRVETLIRHALENGAQHFVFTGDISDNANENDFIIFKEILKKFDIYSSNKTTLVIGNHDIFGGPQTAQDLLKFPEKCSNTDYHQRVYNFVAHFKELFNGTYRLSEEIFFPFVKVLDKIALIGINTIDVYSKLKNPFASNGHVSKAQRKAFGQLLFNHDLKDKIKVVLAHHHFYRKNVSSSSSKDSLWDKIESFTMKLRGKKKLIKLFAENNVKLVLHGHSHEMREYKRKEIKFLNAGASVDAYSSGNARLYLIDVFQNIISAELYVLEEVKTSTASHSYAPKFLSCVSSSGH